MIRGSNSLITNVITFSMAKKPKQVKVSVYYDHIPEDVGQLHPTTSDDTGLGQVVY